VAQLDYATWWWIRPAPSLSPAWAWKQERSHHCAPLFLLYVTPTTTQVVLPRLGASLGTTTVVQQCGQFQASLQADDFAEIANLALFRLLHYSHHLYSASAPGVFWRLPPTAALLEVLASWLGYGCLEACGFSCIYTRTQSYGQARYQSLCREGHTRSIHVNGEAQGSKSTAC